MYLDREEERMWNGEFGPVLEKAIKAVVRYGELMGAERLVSVSHAHVSGISIFNIGDAGLSFIEDIAAGDAAFSVYTTANPYAAVNSSFERRSFPKEVIVKQKRVVEALSKLGAKAFTCAPYYVRHPRTGEHLAWAESNAVLYANSLAGAMTNREGGPIALLEALIGKAPYYGMHLRDERIPEYVIEVPMPSSYVESAVIGYLIGLFNPAQTPLVKGLHRGVPEHWLRAMLAGFGASSHQPLMLIDGISPDLEHLRNSNSLTELEKASIDEHDVRSFIKDHECSSADVLVVGCPHASQGEVSEILRGIYRLAGSRNASIKEFWIVTGEFAADSVAKAAKRVRNVSCVCVKVLKNVCPVVTKLSEIGVAEVCTDSAKALHYMPKLAGVRTCALCCLR